MKGYELNFSGSLKPREKLIAMGAGALSEAELLALILQTGTKNKTVYVIARDLVHYLYTNKTRITFKTLEKFEGIGRVKALKILATIEFSRRWKNNRQRTSILSCSDAYKLVHDISQKNREHFVMVTLDGTLAVIKKRILCIGSHNRNIINAREIFVHAVQDRASNIILAHNHPSGNLQPSPDDISTTTRLKKAGEVLCINLIDHLIVTKTDYFSF